MGKGYFGHAEEPRQAGAKDKDEAGGGSHTDHPESPKVLTENEILFWIQQKHH
jgi:hypothetical protein